MKKSTWKERFSKFILAVFVVGIIFSCSNIEQVQAAQRRALIIMELCLTVQRAVRNMVPGSLELKSEIHQ